MDIILIAGLWLKVSAWDDVVSELRRRGHRPIPLALPGADDNSPTATLEDQVAAALAAVDDADMPMVVGHSAASSLAWMVADRRASAIERVVMIGGFPDADGGTYADFFDMENGVMPFPGWGPFDGADSADLDKATREGIAAAAVPVPEQVATGVVRLTDERRYDVPVTLICPEFTPDDVKTWIKDGQIPELAAARNVSYVDLDSGHWPMFTRPADLAEILHRAASKA